MTRGVPRRSTRSWRRSNGTLVVDVDDATGLCLTGARFDAMHVVSPYMRDCVFEDVRVDHFAAVGHRGVPLEFVNCIFKNCDITANLVTNSSFESVTFSGGWLRGWRCLGSSFINCAFSCQVVSGFVDASPYAGSQRANVSRNDFSDADLCDFEFRGGVDLTQQRLPTAPPYRVVWDCRGLLDYLSTKVTIKSIDDPSRKSDLEVFATLLNANLQGGQHHQLLDSRELKPSVWASIEASGLVARP